jgi:glycerol-3-phosphate dehydrogenase
VNDRRLRTLPQTTADHLLACYGADVGEILDIAAVMPGALRPIKDGEPAVVAEVVYAARRELAA